MASEEFSKSKSYFINSARLKVNEFSLVKSIPVDRLKVIHLQIFCFTVFSTESLTATCAAAFELSEPTKLELKT